MIRDKIKKKLKIIIKRMRIKFNINIKQNKILKDKIEKKIKKSKE